MRTALFFKFFPENWIRAQDTLQLHNKKPELLLINYTNLRLNFEKQSDIAIRDAPFHW